eukprot:9643244-Karenia_brevis.AAC.1
MPSSSSEPPITAVDSTTAPSVNTSTLSEARPTSQPGDCLTRHEVAGLEALAQPQGTNLSAKPPAL